MALLLGPALAGCGGGDDGGDGGGPVAVDSPDLTGADAAACASLLDDLPATLAGRAAREVSPASAPAAAWGDPALVLTCGVEEPAGLDEFASCQVVDGVDWFVPPEQLDDPEGDVLMTTVGTRPRVSLLVPADLRGSTSSTALVELAEPVKDDLEKVDRCG